MSIGKNSTAGSELIKIGGFDVLRSLEAKVVIAEVIGENHNDVGLVLWAIRFREERDRCYQQEDQDISFDV